MKYISLLLFLLITVKPVFTQPDDAYIRKLSGDVDLVRLKDIAAEAPMHPLVWESRSVHGFKSTHEKVRRQAILAESWRILKNSQGANPISEAILLPHQFEDTRDYVSACT